jgi:hypothetical protein
MHPELAEIVEKEAVKTDRGHDGATWPKVTKRLPKTLAGNQ